MGRTVTSLFGAVPRPIERSLSWAREDVRRGCWAENDDPVIYTLRCGHTYGYVGALMPAARVTFFTRFNLSGGILLVYVERRWGSIALR